MQAKAERSIEVAVINGIMLLLAVITAGMFLIANTAVASLLSERDEPISREASMLMCQKYEELQVFYSEGLPGTNSTFPYSGLVNLTIEGSGRASGSAYSDAFYLYTNGEARSIEPEHPQDWILAINSRLAHTYTKEQRVPPYSPDHVYNLEIIAPGGTLQFGIDDGYAADNDGMLNITICQP
ncbi:MAG: hypothetical protein PVF85_10675 [Anaerolineales bacterium]|jgi:hypothetical protein